MNTLERFLAGSSQNIAGVIAALPRDDVPLQSGDIVCAAGSVVEDLSTPRSDLDVIWISSAPPKLRPDARAIGNLRIDLAFVAEEEILAVGRKIQSTMEAARSDPRVIAPLSNRDYQLIHRLRHALPLINAPKLAELQRELCDIPLAEAMATHAAVYSQSWQEDIVGFLEDADEESAAGLLPEFLGCVADVLLHTLSDTSSATKFRLRRLRRLEPTIELQTFPGPALPTPFANWYFEQICPVCSRGLTIERATNAVRLANQVIPWSQNVFNPRLS